MRLEWDSSPEERDSGSLWDFNSAPRGKGGYEETCRTVRKRQKQPRKREREREESREIIADTRIIALLKRADQDAK